MTTQFEHSRNPIVARFYMAKAFALRQRPVDLERRLRADASAAFARSPVVPATAWDIYKRFTSVPCFADCGWLAQGGVYTITGKEEYHFSLVRQTVGLEHWNDEFHQVELLLLHPPTPELRALKLKSMWSFDHTTFDGFFAWCESFPEVRQVLNHRGGDWTWQVNLYET